MAVGYWLSVVSKSCDSCKRCYRHKRVNEDRGLTVVPLTADG